MAAGLKRSPASGATPSFSPGPCGLEQAEGGEQAKPVIVAALVGEVALFREQAQAFDAVVTAEDVALLTGSRGREDEIALLDDQQEEQAVDQAQQVLVVSFRRQLAIADGLPQRFVIPMGDEAIGEITDGLLDSLGQAIANPCAGIERILVVALDQAFGGGIVAERQAGGVQQPVEHREVGKQAVGKDAVEVEFEVGELDQPRAVAQQAQQTAVGDEAVEFVMQVEVFLHQSMRRHARRADVGALGLAVQPGRFTVADHMDGCLAAIDGAVRDRVVLAVELDALGLVFELVAEQTEQRHDPLLAGFGGGRGIRLQAIQLALEDAPVVLRIGPGTGDFVLDLGAGVEIEVGRALAG